MSNIQLSNYTPEELIAIMNQQVFFEEELGEELVDDLVNDLTMITGYTEEEAREAAKAIREEDQIKF